MTVDPVLAWAFGGIGVFAWTVAGLLARKPLRLLRAGGRAKGTVESSEARQVSGKSGTRTYYLPTVSFTTARGERIVFNSSSGGTVAPAKGSTLDVVYDPANPHDAEVGGFRLWIFPIALIVLSSPFLFVGIAGLL
jgi:Protein of unknown function (DUF3592)